MYAARVDAAGQGGSGRVLAQRRSAGVASRGRERAVAWDEGDCWSIAEAAGHEGWHRMQGLLGSYRWDWRGLRGELPALAAAWLPCDPGDLIGPGIGRRRPGSGKDPRPGCGLSGRRTGLPAVGQPSRRLRAPVLCRACGHGGLPGVEEGDDGQDALVGVQGGVDPELAEDAVDVLFHRTLRYPQGLGDPGVGLTLGHQRQHLSFS